MAVTDDDVEAALVDGDVVVVAAFSWSVVVEAATFVVIWLLAVLGNVLITWTLLRRGLLATPSNRSATSMSSTHFLHRSFPIGWGATPPPSGLFLGGS